MEATKNINILSYTDKRAYEDYLREDLKACGFNADISHWNASHEKNEADHLPEIILLGPDAIYNEEKVLHLLQLHSATNRFETSFFIIGDFQESNPLKVESVSQIIHAMNFWQDKYLEAQVEGIKQGLPASRLLTLEQINTGIGDLIRDIRAAEHSGFTSLVDGRYQQLLEWLEVPKPDLKSFPDPLNFDEWFETEEATEDPVFPETEKADKSRKPLPPPEDEELDLLTLDDLMKAESGAFPYFGIDEPDLTGDAEEDEPFSLDFSPKDIPGASVLKPEDWIAFRQMEQDMKSAEEAAEEKPEETETDQSETEKPESTLNESDLNLYRRLAILYAGQKDMKRALKMVQKAIKKGDRSIETEVLHAKLLFKAGKRKKALDKWLQTCRKDPMQFNVATATTFGLSASAITLIEKGIEKKTILRNEVVFITGATAGIGEAIAKIFAKEGFRIVITGRRKNKLESLKSELERLYNARVLSFELDVRDADAVDSVKQSLPDDWAPVHILVNNAGLAKGLSPIHQGNTDDWNAMIDTNLKGLLHVTRALTPGMVARGNGHIINIGSVSGKEVYPNGNVYCATKFAVEGLTRAMRLDLHTQNIRVSTVSPGHVETEFALVRFDGDHEKADIYRDFQPLSPADVAEVVYFVATRPARVNIQDVLMFSSQQASATVIDRSGRKI